MKIISYSVAIILISVTLTACGKQEQITKKENSNINNGGAEFRRPDFGQPERTPDVMGLVKSVVGNQVTILKIDRGSEEEREARRKEMQESGDTKAAPAIGGAPTMHGMGMGGMRSGGSSGRSEADMLAMMKDRSTGEMVVTVPVGIRMLKTDPSSVPGERKGSPVLIEGTLEDVKQDKMISIWLNNDIKDRKIADFVLFR